jgi:hypothetical protein
MESCRLQDHRAQSPSGGRWHVGDSHEVDCLAGAVEERLVPRVLVGRRCG